MPQLNYSGSGCNDYAHIYNEIEEVRASRYILTRQTRNMSERTHVLLMANNERIAMKRQHRQITMTNIHMCMIVLSELRPHIVCHGHV